MLNTGISLSVAAIPEGLVEGELFGQNQDAKAPVISNTTTQRPVVPQAPRQTQLESGEALRARVREVRLEPIEEPAGASRSPSTLSSSKS